MAKKILTFLSILLVIIVIFMLQIYVIDNRTLFGVKPNLILILVISVSLWYGLYVGSFFAFAIGLLTDMIFGNTFGLFTISYTIVGVIIGYFNYNYRKENKNSLVYVALFATVIFEFSQSIIYLLITHEFINIFYFLKQIIIASLLNICLSYILYSLLYKINKGINKELVEDTGFQSIR